MTQKDKEIQKAVDAYLATKYLPGLIGQEVKKAVEIMKKNLKEELMYQIAEGFARIRKQEKTK